MAAADDCQSIRESASREYRGWLPGLLHQQLYLSSSAEQKPAARVVARTTNGKYRDDGGLGPELRRKTLEYRSPVSWGLLAGNEDEEGRPNLDARRAGSIASIGSRSNVLASTQQFRILRCRTALSKLTNAQTQVWVKFRVDLG